MSDASYNFLSVLRRGLGALLHDPAGAGARVTVPASFSVGGQAVTGLPSLALRGPGDIVGFDGGVVRRTWPCAEANNAEPNYFALAELSEPDLPWRYTPAPTGGDRLMPWLCLVVVAEREIASFVQASRERPLAVLTVSDGGALPNLGQAWGWAHAQILGAPPGSATDFTTTAVGDVLAHSPATAIARLLCPRKLEPETRYLACIVPTFERGRLAGLGQPVDNIDRMAPAWTAGAPSVTLPVYYAWRFQTGQPGDFATLVRLLRARKDLPDSVWERDLAVSPPGTSPPAWQVTKLEGALRTLDGQHVPWSGIDAHGFTAAMASRTNVTGPVLAPPLYGRWLAKSASLSTAPNAVPPWFHQLNGDPRARVAAGLGTLTVQAEQQQLLAGAWAQVDGIRRINERLRLAQLARELATRIHGRHFSLGGDAFLQLTAPLHGRVRAGASTAEAQLTASPIVDGAVGAAWRRVARPMGSLGVRQGRPASTPAPSQATGALARLNSGALSVVPVPPPVAGTGAAARLGDLGAVFKKVGVTPDKLHTVPVSHAFTVALHAPIASTTAATTATSGTTAATIGTVSTVATATAMTHFAQAASALMTHLATPLQPGIQWVQANLDTLHTSVTDGLHPKQTIEVPLAGRLGGVVAGPTRTDPIEPVMAAPDFPQPMYEPLKNLSQSWLIPGLDDVPANTVALLATNWPFVESYLVGLNHEMARKLLWNGYPTDQRGTYFKHFWDIRSRTDGSTGGDIGPIHAWTADLGGNRALPVDPLVLLVRGELIRRYPNVVVYATPAVMQDGVRQPGTAERQPLFFGRLDPDVALFGFDLDPDEVRGDPGWFFVLQEHPSEPRFGLAASTGAWGSKPATWQALGWDHLVGSAQAFADLRYIDLGAALPQNPTTAGDLSGAVWHADASRAADLAHITFRQPKRLAVHGSVLVPAGAHHA